MSAVDIGTIKNPVAFLLGIIVAFILWHVGFSEVALFMLCTSIILSTYYTAVYLPKKNVSMIGGLTRAQYGYISGFTIMLSGNVLLCGTLFWKNNLFIYIASVLILIGTGAMVVSSSVLFRHIIRRGLKSNS